MIILSPEKNKNDMISHETRDATREGEEKERRTREEGEKNKSRRSV